MNINIEKIVKIYGEEYINLIKENIDDIHLNINTLINLGFNDIEDIFERVTPIFINDNKKFIEEINGLIAKIGSDYVNIIESDLGLLEELEW